MGSVQRRNYPEAFKREAVERVGSSGLTVGKVASELVSRFIVWEAILRRWLRQLSPAGAAPTTLQPPVHAITPSIVVGGSGSREPPPAPGERALEDGARDPKKTVTIFGVGTGAR